MSPLLNEYIYNTMGCFLQRESHIENRFPNHTSASVIKIQTPRTQKALLTFQAILVDHELVKHCLPVQPLRTQEALPAFQSRPVPHCLPV